MRHGGAGKAENGRGQRRLLSVMGAINWDVSIFEDRFARPGEEVPVTRVEEFSGGKGANVAVAAARILGRGKAAFVGALGTDEIAGRQLKELRREGVVADGVFTISGSRSGRAYVIVDGGGGKTIHTHFGANELIRPSHLDARGPAGVLARSDTVIIMDCPTEVGVAAARGAGARGARVIYSPGVRTREGRHSLNEMVGLADMLVVDRVELMNLSRGEDAAEAADSLARESPSLTVVATTGKSGCVIARAGATVPVEGVELSALRMQAVNTTGCGDAFLGVFASYLAGGASPLEAAKWANLAGAMKAARYETRGSPRRGELESAMRKLEAFRRGQLGLRENTAAWPARQR
jgi:ribokinase